MFTNGRKIGHNGSSRGKPFAIFSLIVGAIMLAVISCGSDVSDAEFNAAMKNLETEKTDSQALRSELAMERADTARLVVIVDRIEARIAELESKLAKERAGIAKRQESADKASAQAALLAAFLAWNRKDREGFKASFTENGISETALSIPVNLGEPPIALRRLMDAAVTDGAATVHAMFALGTQRHSVRYSMAKQDGVWKIEGEDRLSPKVHGDTPVVALKVEGCSPLSERESMIDRNVAFRVENSGREHPHLILRRVPEDIDLGELLQGDEAPSESLADVAFFRETKAGESINIAFTEPLQPGRYVLLCYPQEPEGINRGHPAAGSIVAAYMVK